MGREILGVVARKDRRRFDAHLHLSQYWANIPKNLYRPDLAFTVEGLLAEMDAQGIGEGLLLQLETAPKVEDTLREGEEMHRRSGGRLHRTSTVDPTRGREEVAHALELWEGAPNLRAIKLYPGYRHFYPHDDRLGPVYDFAARRKLPVLFHQGDTLDPNGLVKYARPIEVDEVAVAHRDVKFVLCHLGNPWIPEAAEIVYKNDNVYTDTSGLVWSPQLPLYSRMFEQAQSALEVAIDQIGDPSRVLYGSDWPLESLDLAVRLVDGLDLPAAEREKILGANARKLFGIPAER